MKYDYYLSNALDETVEELARVIVASHRVEDCFRRAKDACGLADYEVQTWYGWHHHVTMSMLACWFLTKEMLRGKKDCVSLTVPLVQRFLSGRLRHYVSRFRPGWVQTRYTASFFAKGTSILLPLCRQKYLAAKTIQ